MFYRFERESNGEFTKSKILVLGDNNIEAIYIDNYEYDKAIEDELYAKDIINKYGYMINKDDRIYRNSKVMFAYSAPIKLFVDITNKCNLSCKHCLSGIEKS